MFLLFSIVVGFLLTIALNWGASRVNLLRWISPYKAAGLAAILYTVSQVALAVVTCDSDCRLFFPLVIGGMVLGAICALAGATFALMVILYRQQT
ncbi:hypothetical protein [Nioella aestuarii]|uniref:hypothetical protein n=1 Tax=Nioella aestuarii TaxID=1662864 RepID=UPI003D7FEF59